MVKAFLKLFGNYGEYQILPCNLETVYSEPNEAH